LVTSWLIYDTDQKQTHSRLTTSAADDDADVVVIDDVLSDTETGGPELVVNDNIGQLLVAMPTCLLSLVTETAVLLGYGDAGWVVLGCSG